MLLTVRRLAGGIAAATLMVVAAPDWAAAQAVRVTGAGASFPFPLYSAWTQQFSARQPGVRIDYQSTGSARASAPSSTAPSISPAATPR
jgi:ABC-type phosphate transport system substrate-binding protein